MKRESLRVFLAASAVAMLGILGAGSAVGQQTREKMSDDQVQQFLSGFGFVRRPDGNFCRPANWNNKPTPDCNKNPLPSGCWCPPSIGIKGYFVTGPAGEFRIDIQGLSPEFSQGIMKKAGPPAETK
ncbi:MAG: hypothetical protein WCC12_09380 [Anaerolineales bacterium]